MLRLRDRKQQEAMRRPACLCYALARTVAPLCERRLLPEEQPAVADRRYRSQREIAATDAEIDNLVYELYGISDKERGIIEGSQADARRPPR
jgi:23S rRNA G2445 N2-methylase RlmL